MGYYTNYIIGFEGPKDQVRKAKEQLLEFSKFDKDSDPDPDVIQLLENDSVFAKLYDLPGWCEMVAQLFPDVLIELDGSGEDSMDAWEQRWLGTETEYHESVMPKFKKLLTKEEKSKK